MIALGLGVLGLGLSFVRSKAAMGGAMVIGIGAAGALIGMMLDVIKQIKADMSSMGGSNGDKGASEGFGDFGKELGDQMKITADFTPWFMWRWWLSLQQLFSVTNGCNLPKPDIIISQTKSFITKNNYYGQKNVNHHFVSRTDWRLLFGLGRRGQRI